MLHALKSIVNLAVATNHIFPLLDLFLLRRIAITWNETFKPGIFFLVLFGIDFGLAHCGIPPRSEHAHAHRRLILGVIFCTTALALTVFVSAWTRPPLRATTALAYIFTTALVAIVAGLSNAVLLADVAEYASDDDTDEGHVQPDKRLKICLPLFVAAKVFVVIVTTILISITSGRERENSGANNDKEGNNDVDGGPSPSQSTRDILLILVTFVCLIIWMVYRPRRPISLVLTTDPAAYIVDGLGHVPETFSRGSSFLQTAGREFHLELTSLALAPTLILPLVEWLYPGTVLPGLFG